jgi:elongation factor G
MSFPEPVISIAVEPKTQADIDKLSMALNKLAEEDPTFKVKLMKIQVRPLSVVWVNCTWKFLLTGLKREFKVECNQGAPQVAYREAITTVKTSRGIQKTKSGGRGKFADIIFEMGPADENIAGCSLLMR